MTYVRMCRQVLALFYTAIYIYEYRLFRAVKFRFLFEYMWRRRRIAAFWSYCVQYELRRRVRTARIADMRSSCVFYHRRGYSKHEAAKIYWEAPLAMSIWKDGEPIFGIAVEFWGRTLCIRQLQGVPGAHIPDELKDWPQLLLKGSILFARKMKYARVRLYRADQSLFYHFPYFSDASANEAAARKEALQKRMRRRYDGTARQLGLTMKSRWGEWVNPNWGRTK